MEEKQITRRTALKAAAWTVPAVAVAIATPALAASELTAGNLSINGTCGTLGVLGPGFILNADPNHALPIGTQITISGSGIANIGVLNLSQEIASVEVLANSNRVFTLNQPLPAGGNLALRTLLSLSVDYTLQAVVTLPLDYTAGGEAKLNASLRNGLLITCTAS